MSHPKRDTVAAAAQAHSTSAWLTAHRAPGLDDLDRPGESRQGVSGSAVALPLVVTVAVDQSRSPALADIIGARRVRTAVMISSGSIPCR
jgi:hypothetical protein